MDRVISADPFKFTVFDDAQYFFLHPIRGARQLIQEQAALVGQFKAPETATDSAGEGAGLVAKQFRFEQRFGQCGAIELDEGAVPSW